MYKPLSADVYQIMIIIVIQNFRDAMKPNIKHVVMSRDLGIAEVQFQVMFVLSHL